MRDAQGFTLVELMIAVAVAMGLLVAVYMAVNSTQRHSSAIEGKVTAQQDVKPVLDLMAMEIGMASYNQYKTVGNWLLASDCTTVSPNQAPNQPDYRGIQEATTTAMTVEMDVNDNCTVDNDPICMRNYTGNPNPNEVIRYNYDTGNQYITRATNCGSGQPFLGDTVASGRPRTVRVINNTLGIPVFRYYDGAGAEIASTGLPAGIPNIRRIEIVLAVETENVDANTGQRRRLIYSTSVIPRNHAIQ